MTRNILAQDTLKLPAKSEHKHVSTYDKQNNEKHNEIDLCKTQRGGNIV